jgi:hypothetical protein
MLPTAMGWRMGGNTLVISVQKKIGERGMDSNFQLNKYHELPVLLYIVKCTAILVTAIIFFGCSTTRVAYNFSDHFIRWRLKHYIHLTREQDGWLEERLNTLMEWHRKEQLPRYIRFIEQVKIDATNGLTTEILNQHYETLRDFMRDIMLHIEPDMSYLLSSLSNQQKKELMQTLLKEQKELDDETSKNSAEKKRQERIKQTNMIFQLFIGKLNSPQKLDIDKWANNRMPLERLWIQNRRNWINIFENFIMGNEKDEDRNNKFSGNEPSVPKDHLNLKDLMVYPESLWSMEYQNVMNHNRNITMELIVNIHRQLLASQLNHLIKYLENLGADLLYLSGKNSIA